MFIGNIKFNKLLELNKNFLEKIKLNRKYDNFKL